MSPNGPGGGEPVTGWELGIGFSIGSYQIGVTGTTACIPETTQGCKYGGWRNFPGFRNQGDCVSFVATGGKNPPDNP